jgi:hypothetical protein
MRYKYQLYASQPAQAQRQALMILALDAPFSREQIDKLLALPDVYTAKVVKI